MVIVWGFGNQWEVGASLRERAATGSLFAHPAEGGTSLAHPWLLPRSAW